MLLAIRDGETSSFTSEGIADLQLDRLDDREAALLLDATDTPVTIESRARVLALAQGNPLAILELPDLVALEPELGMREPSLPSGSIISRAFGRRIEGLPRDTRFALMLAAANDDDDLRTILRACAVAGIEPNALTLGEAAGVLSIDADTLTFRHPLVRAVAYAGATPAERRDAHRALAEALLDRRAEARWAWHRALAAIGPDEVAAAALEEIATASSSASATARALEQAARLSIGSHSRTRRLIAAALAAEAAGRLRLAQSLAEEARPDAIEPVERAEVDHLLGRILANDGEVTKAVELLTAGAEAIAEVDPDRAARMLADAVDTAIDDLDVAGPIAERALALLRSDRASEQLVFLRYGDVLGWKGDAVAAAAAWRRSADLADVGDAWSVRLAAEALFSAGLDDDAVVTAGSAVDLARGRGQLTALTQSLEFQALADARRGRLLDALDAATEELDLVSSLGQLREERSAAASVAWIEALLGREADCRAHVGAGGGIGRSNGVDGSAQDGPRGARARAWTSRGRGIGHARQCHEHGWSRRGRHRPVLVRPIARRGPRAVGSRRRCGPDREGVSIRGGAIGTPGPRGARPSMPWPGRGFRRGPAGSGGHPHRGQPTPTRRGERSSASAACSVGGGSVSRPERA